MSKKKLPKKVLPPHLSEVEVEFTYQCPTRGLVTQVVTGKRYAQIKYVPALTRIDLDEFNLTDLDPIGDEDDSIK